MRRKIRFLLFLYLVIAPLNAVALSLTPIGGVACGFEVPNLKGLDSVYSIIDENPEVAFNLSRSRSRSIPEYNYVTGVLYACGLGVSKSYEKALDHLRLSKLNASDSNSGVALWWAANKAQVKVVQFALSDLGYDEIVVDGVYGEQTKNIVLRANKNASIAQHFVQKEDNGQYQPEWWTTARAADYRRKNTPEEISSEYVVMLERVDEPPALAEVSSVTEGKRVALLVGNSRYGNGPLKNPVNDVRSLATALENLSFQVIKVENVNYSEFRRALDKFSSALQLAGPDATGLFYFSGHGTQVDGKNYLAPLGYVLESKVDFDLEFIEARRIESAMASLKSGVKILLLDACRNNPFKSFDRAPRVGLAQMDAATGTIIAYATAPGAVAMDGEGDNSPFIEGLLKALVVPNIPIEQTIKLTRQHVSNVTNGQQIPWTSSSLIGDFSFIP